MHINRKAFLVHMLVFIESSLRQCISILYGYDEISISGEIVDQKWLCF